MTDISVIKMIISVAVWRIYPSWVNDKLRAWEGLGHSGMFWARLSRDDFRLKLKIISFLSRVMSVSKSFCVSRAFERFGAKRSSSGAFGFDDDLKVFLKTLLRHRAFFCELRLRPQVFFENFLSFFKAKPVLLAWQLNLWRPPGWVKHFGDGTSNTRMRTWLRIPGVGEIERRRTIDRCRDWYKSCAVIHGPKENKKQGCQCVIARRLNPSSYTNQRILRSLFPRPFRTWLRCFRRRGCAAAGRSGCSTGKAKKSSHPWHFRCWSLRRNELEDTDLVHWTGALHRFSSRDAIIAVGSVLEKHFDSDFTPDQEKEITFKRWPPGYQCSKLGLALNGLRKQQRATF